jgi:hypothetical protein
MEHATCVMIAAGRRRYKRRCDLAGCQKCYTSPDQGCYGRSCAEMYTCEADKCSSGYTYSDASGMCDCKEGYGIVLGKCSYARYRRQSFPGYSKHYAGGCWNTLLSFVCAAGTPTAIMVMGEDVYMLRANKTSRI